MFCSIKLPFLGVSAKKTYNVVLFFLGKYLHFSDFGLNFVKSL